MELDPPTTAIVVMHPQGDIVLAEGGYDVVVAARTVAALTGAGQ